MGLYDFFNIAKSIEENQNNIDEYCECSKIQNYKKLSLLLRFILHDKEKTCNNDLKKRLKQPIVDFKTQTLGLVEKIQQNIDDITRLKDIIQQIEENIKVETDKLKELVNSKKQMKEELSNSKLKAQELIDKFNQDLDNIISKV